MEITSIAKELPTFSVEPSAGTSNGATGNSSSQSQVPVSVYSAEIDGQTEGVQVSEVGGTYFAGVPGPPDVTTSGSSLAGAEDKLAYIVNLFA